MPATLTYTYTDIAKMIDHSLLNPTLTDKELEAGCRLAVEYQVASVCILPYYLKRCAEILKGSDVRASTTIGFNGSYKNVYGCCSAMMRWSSRPILTTCS